MHWKKDEKGVNSAFNLNYILVSCHINFCVEYILIFVIPPSATHFETPVGNCGMTLLTISSLWQLLAFSTSYWLFRADLTPCLTWSFTLILR